MALGEEGEVFGWGNSEYGQLSAVTSEQQVGQRFSNNKSWLRNQEETLDLDCAGLALTDNLFEVCEPTLLPLPEVGPAADVASGGTVCLVAGRDGRVWVWGFGALGLGPGRDQAAQPQLIPSVVLYCTHNYSKLQHFCSYSATAA